MIELFQVKTAMPVLRGHKDVQINWFIPSRTRPVARYGEGSPTTIPQPRRTPC